MHFIKTQALLLRETLLANDDVLLDLFTYELGRVSVFVSKLQRSKKKRPEIDFFRIMEVEIVEKNNNFKLRLVHTTKVFHSFSHDYKTLEDGFLLLKRLQKILPEQKPLKEFFILLCSLFETLNTENKKIYWAYLRIHILVISGIMPRFDIVRGESFFDPENLTFHDTKKPHFSYIDNESRQIIEFLRRLQFSELFFEYKKVLDIDLSIVEKLLLEVEEFH